MAHNVVFVPKNDELADKDINCHNIVAEEEFKVWTHRCPENLVGGPMDGQGPHAGQADSPFDRFADPLAWESMPLLGVGPPRARRGRASEMRPVAEQAVKQAALWG